MVTSFRSAVDPRGASHVEGARHFPCFMPKLLLRDRTRSYNLRKLARIVTFAEKIEKKLALKFSTFGS